MKVEDGKIVEATENEMFSLYLERGMDDVMDFHEYRRRMEKAGCRVMLRNRVAGENSVAEVPGNHSCKTAGTV